MGLFVCLCLEREEEGKEVFYKRVEVCLCQEKKGVEKKVCIGLWRCVCVRRRLCKSAVVTTLPLPVSL